MKRVLIYIPLFITLVNTASAGQLFKIPVLVSHYLEHHHLNERVGLIEFLSMHYWGTDINDNDQDKDMQLPFKSSQHNCCAQQPSIPVASAPVLDQTTYQEKPDYTIPDESCLNDPALHSLFRPPRI